MQYIVFAAMIAVLGAILYRQQRTIERLTDKLMARSYVEYKSLDKSIKEDDVSPVRDDDEPKSWFDH